MSSIEFDYVIINEDFDLALAQLTSIVTATRLRYASQAARMPPPRILKGPEMAG